MKTWLLRISVVLCALTLLAVGSWWGWMRICSGRQLLNALDAPNPAKARFLLPGFANMRYLTHDTLLKNERWLLSAYPRAFLKRCCDAISEVVDAVMPELRSDFDAIRRPVHRLWPHVLSARFKSSTHDVGANRIVGAAE